MAELRALTSEQIATYARDVITGKCLLADARDRDWQHSMALLLSAWENVPPNCSTIFLVPMKDHAGGLWLNGRVPGVTVAAHPVPMESVDALLDQIRAFDAALNPGPTPEVREDET